MKRLLPYLLLAALALPTQAFARVKLITLPVRERIEIQLDHASATLVEEERIVPLVEGVNQVDFSWAGTRIDPGTIVFRVIGWAGDTGGEPPAVNVLSVSYPPGENALVWDVSAVQAGPYRVRISYLLGGLDKSFNYRAVAGNDEKTLELRQYIRVKNLANEAYRDTTVHAGYGGSFSQPIGLNQTKEMLFRTYADVPVVKTFSCDPAAHGYLDRAQDKLMVPMHYVLINDEAHALGAAPLPGGKVRIFQKDSAGTTAFLGEDWGRFTPIDEKMRLYLGVAQDVVVKRTIDDRKRQRVAGNLYHHRVTLKYEIENFKDQPMRLDLTEQIQHLRNEIGLGNNRPPQWTIGDATTLDGGVVQDESDLTRVTYHVDLPARDGDEAETVVKKLEIVFSNEW